MSRVPLPSTTGQAMMQGLMAANQMRMNAARQQLMGAQGQSLLGNLAIAQKLEPVRANLMNAQGTSLLGNLAISKALEPARAQYFSGMGARGSEMAAAQRALLPYQEQEANLKVNPQAAAQFMAARFNAMRSLLGGQPVSAPGMIPTGTGASAPLNTSTSSISPALAVNATAPIQSPQSAQAVGSAPVEPQPTESSSYDPTVTSGPMMSSTGPTQAMADVPGMAETAEMGALGIDINKIPKVQVAEKTAALEQAQNAKLIPTLATQIQTLGQQMNQLDKMRNIVESPDGQNWDHGGIFGFGSGLPNKFRNNKNIGAFKNLSSGILAALNKEMGGSHGGGKWLTNFNKGFKPSTDVAIGQNAGIIQSQGQSMQNKLQDLYQNWTAAGGNPNYFPWIKQALSQNRYSDITPNATTRMLNGNRYVKVGGDKWLQR